MAATTLHRHVHRSNITARRQIWPHQTTSAQRLPRARHLTSTAPLLRTRKRIVPLRALPKSAPQPPPYPYENPQKLFKQHLTGLYGGAMVHFGNIVSGRNEIKTRRTWHPNTMHKRLYSLALGRFIRVKLTARVLRTVEKHGGIDEYLLGSTPQRVKELGEEGWRLRWLVLQALRAQGSDRVRTDPRLRRELELGDALAVSGAAAANAAATSVHVGPPMDEAAAGVGEELEAEEEEEAELDVEGRVLRRLDEDRLMREEVDVRPPTLLQRVGNTIHAPVEWMGRKLFRRR